MDKQKLKEFIMFMLNIVSNFFPVKDNRIVFRSFDNKYNCNPKYVCEYFLKNYGIDKFSLVYITDDKNTQKELRQKGLKSCGNNTLQFFYYMFTAKFFIVNHNYPSYLPKKKSQIIINTWHGGGSYKKLLDNHTTSKEYARVDKFISSCESFSKNNLLGDFYLKNQQLFEIGMPRNDIFFKPDSDIKKRVKDILKIEQSKKIILYAPTFFVHKKELIPEDFKRVISACEKRFGEEFVLVNRDHHFSLKDTSAGANDDYVYESQIIKDTQELLCAADIVITDYSSIMWDASLSDALCFIYAHNLEDYNKIWGFYTPIEEWPFPTGKTIDELVDRILSFDEEKYKKDVAEHHKALGSFENGTACDEVAKYILNQIS